jgi:hypothetical protein
VDPPFVASAGENGYDESLATIKGRFWYVQLKKGSKEIHSTRFLRDKFGVEILATTRLAEIEHWMLSVGLCALLVLLLTR